MRLLIRKFFPATATSSPLLMSEHRIDLKNPYLAALLAFLIPGAGHFYQRRFFKAAIYSICILGTFFYGMALGDWQVVYYRGDPGHRPYGYFAQAMVGLPALPALVQWRRFDPRLEAGPRDPFPQWINELDAPLENVPFNASLEQRGESFGKLSGSLTLEAVSRELGRQMIEGTFEGTLLTREEGVERPVQLRLAGGFGIEQPVVGKKGRLLHVHLPQPGRQLAGVAVPDPHSPVEVVGFVPRKFWNWFLAPPDENELQRLHGSLGKFFELASVFTWIAGLLNILAIWDALEGPAYGYGDEQPAAETASTSNAPDQRTAAASAREPVAAGASTPHSSG